MYNRYFRMALVVVIVVAIITAGYLTTQRFILEKNNRQVEIALLYDEVKSMANYADKTVHEILAEFKKAGITGVLFKEESLVNLFGRTSAMDLTGNDKVSVLSGQQLTLNGIKAKKEYIYLVTDDIDTYERMKRHLKVKLPEQVLYFPPEPVKGLYLIGISPEYEMAVNLKKTSIGLGFPKDELDKVATEKLNILIQIANWPDYGNINEAFEIYREEFTPYINNLSLIAFNDAEIPGHPGKIHELAKEITDFNVPVGFVETFIFKQEGIKQLGKLKVNGITLNKRITRVHSISAGEMKTYTPQEAIDRFELAVSERNVRVLLVRLFPETDPQLFIQKNLDYVDELANILKSKGFTLGKAATFNWDITSQAARKLFLLLIGLGIIAAGLLFMDIIGLPRLGLVLALLSTVGWILLFIPTNLAKYFETSVKLMALSSVIIFPTLGITITLRDKESRKLGDAIIQFLKMTAISMTGAFLAVGLLAHLNYMLKLDQFAGVKAGLLAPILIVACIFYMRPDKEDIRLKIKNLLNQPMTLFMFAAFIIFMVLLLILVLRSGNVGVITGIEEQFRTIIRQILGVRPRTKEFLIGHPLMLLLLYLGYKDRLLPLLILGAIGQVSLVNTFEHIHTPIMISVIRTFHGLWLGILGGIVLIGLYHFLFVMKGRIKYEKEE